MSRSVASLIRAVPKLLPAMIGLAVLSAGVAPAADECLAEPKLQTAQSGHWYYRIDRATHRKCWYVGQPGAPVRHAAPRRALAPPVPHAAAITPVKVAADEQTEPGTPLPGGPDAPIPDATSVLAARSVRTEPILVPAPDAVDRGESSVGDEPQPPSRTVAAPALGAAEPPSEPPRMSEAKPEHPVAPLAGALALALVLAAVIGRATFAHARRSARKVGVASLLAFTRDSLHMGPPPRIRREAPRPARPRGALERPGASPGPLDEHARLQLLLANVWQRRSAKI